MGGIGDHHHHCLPIVDEVGSISRDALGRSQPLPGTCIVLDSANDLAKGRVVLQKIALVNQPSGIECSALREVLCCIDDVVVVRGNR